MTSDDSQVKYWGDKRYHTLNYHLRDKFGSKVFKIPLNAGFTCPNRDGKLGSAGCLYCSAQGSGDFAGDPEQGIKEQFVEIKDVLHRKWEQGKYIAYFQAFTNTYAPAEMLEKVYQTALDESEVVGIAIATRPDCLPDDVVELLNQLNKRTYLWVELGLQTTHARTAASLNLGYGTDAFYEAVQKLTDAGIEVVAHIILGLPGEDRADMLASAQWIAGLPLQGVKIHMLHIMKHTGLARVYQSNPFSLLTQEEYVDLVVDILEILPPSMIIHRLTGDSPRDLLIEPIWTLKKWEVLNNIDRRIEQRHTWQGRLYDTTHPLAKKS